MDKIDTWIENRFGTPNTFNRQLLDNFIEFLEKELGYVIKDRYQNLPENPYEPPLDKTQEIWSDIVIATQSKMRKQHWVKVKEKSNG